MTLRSIRFTPSDVVFSHKVSIHALVHNRESALYPTDLAAEHRSSASRAFLASLDVAEPLNLDRAWSFIPAASTLDLQARSPLSRPPSSPNFFFPCRHSTRAKSCERGESFVSRPFFPTKHYLPFHKILSHRRPCGCGPICVRLLPFPFPRSSVWANIRRG